MRIEIEAEGVRAHASSVGSLQDRTTGAASAAQTTVSGEAFGVMNSFLGAVASGLAAAAKNAVEGLAQDLDRTGGNLRTLATNAETTDDNVAARMKGFGQ